MSRDRSPALIAADTAGHAGGAILIEMLFDAGTLRLTTAPWNMEVAGNVYYATGALLTVSDLEEAADSVQGAEFQMSGLQAGIFELVVGEPYQGRVLRMLEQRYGADDEEVEAPVVEYVGRMKTLTSTENVSDRTHTVTVQTEQFDAEFERAQPIRFSDAEQRRRYPNDRGLEYVTSLTEKTLTRRDPA